MRRSIMTAAAVGLALTLAACGGGKSSPSDPVAKEKQTGTITLWTDGTRIEAFKKIGEQFKEETGVMLDVVEKPTEDVRTDFIAQVPTGKGPDLVVGAHDWVGELVTNGVIQPVELGDKLKDFNSLAISGFTYNGQVFGVPYSVENLGLVRNNALVKTTPATLDELIAAKPAAAQFPLLIQVGEGDPYHLYPLQSSFDAPVFVQGADGAYTTELGMGGEPGKNFANYLKKLAGEGVLATTIGGDQAKQAFLDGKSPYVITGAWWTSEFKKANMDISVVPIPAAGPKPSAPFVGVQGVYLSSKTENALLANQFLTFLTSEKVQTTLYEHAGRMPALTAAAKKVNDPILTGFAAAGEKGQPMPSLPEMAAVWKFWGTTEVAIIDGAAPDPAAAWATMIDNIKGAFKK